MSVLACGTRTTRHQSRDARSRMAAREHHDALADVRRDQMLAAASTLIAERGFSDTRIADVAKRVGASPALVIYYFGTKDSLLTEALRWSERSFYTAAET